MRRKMLNVPKGSYDGMKGFTIVEFLVAGLLSMIVLMAVGSSYFTSRKLNDAANERLSAQQDLRNAATLIVRDARMAGASVVSICPSILQLMLFPIRRNKTPFFLKKERYR